MIEKYVYTSKMLTNMFTIIVSFRSSNNHTIAEVRLMINIYYKFNYVE